MSGTLENPRLLGPVESKRSRVQAGGHQHNLPDPVLEGDPLQDWRLIGKPVQALFMDGSLVINRCGLEAQATAMSGSRL